MRRRLVSFIGLGGRESGSDFLYTYLHAHPETYIPKKSTQFFSDPHRYARGADWYEARFSACSKKQIPGECATDYLQNPAAAERIAHLYPEAKLLAVVCNPVDRLYREHQRAIKNGSITPQVSLKRYIDLHPESLARGLFGKQLETYFELYSPLQLRVIVHEDRYKNPIQYIQTVYSFLEIDETFVPKALRQFIVIDPDDPPPRPWWQRLLLLPFAPLRWLRLHHLALKVWRLLKPYINKIIPTRKSAVTNHAQIPPAVPVYGELLDAVHEYYAADVQRLSRIVKRDLNTEWGIMPGAPKQF